MDKKSITETAADAAKIAVGMAAIAVDALRSADQPAEGKPEPQAGAQQPDDGGSGERGTAPAGKPEPAETADTEVRQSVETININNAKFDDLVSLRHIGRGRAKRIMANRPFRSVDDLVSRGIVPEDVLTGVRHRLAV